MERVFQQYSKEYMKMAILKHEETFKEQVHELHRLYRVQKMLMRDMLRQDELMKHHKFMIRQCYGTKCCSCPLCTLNLKRPSKEYIEANDTDTIPKGHEGSDVELSLSLGSNWRKKEDASVASEQGTSFSSSSTESTSANKMFQDWSIFQIPDINLKCADDGNGLATEESNAWNIREQSSWHLQYLRLSTT